jgi:hypothetical protein
MKEKPLPTWTLLRKGSTKEKPLPLRHRIFCEWNDPEAGYISTLVQDFQTVFPQMVSEFGPPDKVEFRADDEGWTR